MIFLILDVGLMIVSRCFLVDGVLMFEQVPMVEIDAMHLVQTRAILKYIAEKYNLNGIDIKERAM